MAELPPDHPFRDSQTLRELMERRGVPGFPRLLLLSGLLVTALCVIAWQISSRAAHVATGAAPQDSAPRTGSPLVQDQEVDRALADAAKSEGGDAADVSAATLVAVPDRMKGARVHVTGIPISMFADKLDPNPAGIDEAWRTYLVERDMRGVVVVWTVERPREWDEIVLGRDLVECEGEFLRLVTYETEDGGSRTAPLVVARNLSRVVLPPDRGIERFESLIGVMIAVVAVALTFLVLHSKREESRHREQVREALGLAPPADGGARG